MPATPLAIESSERSLFSANSPAATAIDAAFRAAFPANTPTVYALAGPSVRITRIKSPPYFVTRVAAVLAPTPTGLAASPGAVATADAALAERLNAALRTVSSSFAPVTIAPFAPAFHGAAATWQSGAAANTRTRDGFDALTADDEPIWPPLRQLPGIGNQVSDTLGNPLRPVEAAAASVGKAALVLGAIAVGGFVLWQGAEWYLLTHRAKARG